MTRRPSPLRRRLLATSTVAALLAGSLLATAVPASAADDPIDGPQTSGDAMFPNVGNGGYDALEYDIDIEWSPTGSTGTGPTDVITGEFQRATTTMTAHAPVALSSFSLDFEGLTIESVSVNGQPAAWTRDIDAAAIKYKLIVAPSVPVVGDFTVTVTYSGAPVFHTDADGSQEGWSGTNDGAMLLGQPIGMMTAFPHNNTPTDKATYTITVDAPTVLADVNGVSAPGAVASNGELVAKTPNAGGDRTTWTWRQQKQMASELVVIGIGRYETVDGVVTLSDGRRIPSLSFIDVGLPESEKTTVRNRIAQLEPITQNLEKMFGPYPGNSTGVIVKTVPEDINYALETQDRSFFPSVRSVTGDTLIHELVHQWYGNNVAPTTWTDIWMGEGMATWAPTYYNSAEGFGTTAASSEQTYFQQWNSRVSTSPSWTIPPGAQTAPASLYGYQTYTRSAQFWAALRVAIGDTAFFELIEKWQIDNAGQSRTGAQLKALATQLSGRDLDAFWSDWILEPGKPAWPDKSSITVTSDAAAPVSPGDTVTYTVSVANTGRVPLAATDVDLDLTGVLANGSVTFSAANVTENGSIVTWDVPATAVGATSQLTITATLDDDAVSGTITTTAASRSLGSSCATCTVAVDVLQDFPTTPAPTIAGEPVVGQTLTASAAGWPEGTTFAYEWAIDGVPVDPSAIQGASTEPVLFAAAAADTSNQFVIPAGAVGSRISVTVTASLAGYRDASVTSASTGPVRAAAVSGGDSDTSSGAAADPGAEGTLSDTGSEFPALAALLALVLLGAGGVFAVARRRRHLAEL
ncbi:M1 family aminopeptidase [Microbacterium sp. 179-I 3D4 NHS]|uniref:M1 family aminopeptidase n=1 Tax=Microbacterium sp. 179-I 3D4 NHS TaxID=3142381 RepID=UPI0039A0CECE